MTQSINSQPLYKGQPVYEMHVKTTSKKGNTRWTFCTWTFLPDLNKMDSFYMKGEWLHVHTKDYFGEQEHKRYKVGKDFELPEAKKVEELVKEDFRADKLSPMETRIVWNVKEARNIFSNMNKTIDSINVVVKEISNTQFNLFLAIHTRAEDVGTLQMHTNNLRIEYSDRAMAERQADLFVKLLKNHFHYQSMTVFV